MPERLGGQRGKTQRFPFLALRRNLMGPTKKWLIIINPDDEEEEIYAKKDHNYKKKGKSKFYNVDSDQIPVEERIGRSKFYGQQTWTKELLREKDSRISLLGIQKVKNQ